MVVSVTARGRLPPAIKIVQGGKKCQCLSLHGGSPGEVGLTAETTVKTFGGA